MTLFDKLHRAESRPIGTRRDGWQVRVSSRVIRGENAYEIKVCEACKRPQTRAHDAEAYRQERRPGC